MKHTLKRIHSGRSEYFYRDYRIVKLPPNGYNSTVLWEIYEPNVQANYSALRMDHKDHWTHCYTLREGKKVIDARIEREEV